MFHCLEKLIHSHTWARGNERSLTDYIPVTNYMKQDELDANVVRGMSNGSDIFEVVAQVRMREAITDGVGTQNNRRS